MTAAEELFEEVLRLLVEEPDNWESILRNGGNKDAWQHGKTFWKHTSGLMVNSNDITKIWKGEQFITSTQCQKVVAVSRKQRKRLIPVLIDLRAEKILRIVKRHDSS